ncbi:MAG: hypothetical protein EDX89_14760 [Acidobacteria bacterium]|nr:MAG: hypothetical protein EDX89_14760 [Acidobacteriota bacterium]
MASVKKRPNPRRSEPSCATYVRSDRTNGPMHGAATKPTKSPIVNAPRTPPLEPVRSVMKWGAWISNRPNIESDRARTTRAIATRTTGFWSHAPKSDPVSAAKTPSAEYVTLIPRTYERASPKALPPFPAACRPKKPTVIGISG